MKKLSALLALTLISFCCFSVSAFAQTVTPTAGWIYSRIVLSDTPQSCVTAAPNGTFVGIGPGFTGNAQDVVLVSESGGESVVVSGLNSIGDCVYDAAGDVLYVTDNALEASGSVTGDTVYAIAGASTAPGVTALGNELLAAGTIASASSVALDAAGDVYVADSTGGGAGSVIKISGGSPSTFASGFDFTGGLAIDSAGNVFVAESLATFDNQISEYDSAGTLVGVTSGPTFAHGSYDLLFENGGGLLVSGAFLGDVVSIDTGTGVGTPFASGFNFATGLTQQAFTGRVQTLSSTFSVPAIEEDLSLHSLTPLAGLVPGKGSTKTECVHEFYGIELVPQKPGKPAKKAICVDGAACDADGVVNQSCTFPIGHCLNVADPAFPECSSGGTAVFELKKTKPESAAAAVTAAAITAAAPIADSTCFFSDGVVVPLKIKNNGDEKAGKGLVKVKVTSTDAKALKDADVAKLVCEPAGL